MMPDRQSSAEVLSGVSNRSANFEPKPPSKSIPLAISREGTDGWRRLRPQQVRRGWGQEGGAHCARQDPSSTQGFFYHPAVSLDVQKRTASRNTNRYAPYLPEKEM